MNSNPFIAEIVALERNYEAARDELGRWKTELSWFTGVDLECASSELMRAQRMKEESQARLGLMRQDIGDLETSVHRLEAEAGMGIDPRHWFSSQRAVAKRQLASMQQKLAEGQKSAARLETVISQAVEDGRAIQDEIERARIFDPLLAQSAIAALQATLDRIAPQLTALRHRSEKLDKTLKEPQLRLYDEDAQRARLLTRIDLAEIFDRKLNKASNGYEKRQIHLECGSSLGDESPGAVMQESRKALRRVDANIEKLRARIAELVKIASRDVRNIVIDGSNLCYEGKELVGLAPLKAIIPILAEDYTVTLIFDASIRRKLKLNDKDIVAAFPEATRVHTVASKRKADELILDVAGEDPSTFILSNDRFAEFPEKSAIKEERVLRHEIVGKMVRIYDLRIAAPIELGADTAAA
ncbi:hypothetical protein CEK29_03320 [Bordetella genomosp. 5]|uniref:NYN domain-containing protein n=1 Tax=Bordetella genomosp. 5 TaxID=1395608 RepID=UPI000B9E4358|nr:hypothetical protein [Bordetella genomosp. 5]OZI47758.1 hypothetical protein CEK29_03320 [Bordetella genomosp. 5]